MQGAVYSAYFTVFSRDYLSLANNEGNSLRN